MPAAKKWEEYFHGSLICQWAEIKGYRQKFNAHPNRNSCQSDFVQNPIAKILAKIAKALGYD